VGGCAGGDVLGGVHADPVDVVPGVVGELGEERPLGAAVSFPERVQRVDVGQEVRHARDELIAGQAAEPVGGGEPAEDVGGGGLQVLQAEHRPFRDGDGPQLAGPGVDVPEDVGVKSL